VLKALQRAVLALGNHLHRRRGGEAAEKGIGGAEGWTECRDLAALVDDDEDELEQSG